MAQNLSQSMVLQSQQIAIIAADERLLQVLNERLTVINSIEEYQKVSEIILEVRKKKELQDIELRMKELEVTKAKTDFIFLKIQRIISTGIGLGLFITSFFLFQSNGLLGGIFFGTGLGALGIAIRSLKSLVK